MSAESEQGWAPGERGRIALLALLVVGAAVYPLRQNWRTDGERVDGFPLSYYPMFSKRRERSARVTYGVGFRVDGSRRYLTPTEMGAGGHNQSRRQLRRVVRAGRVEEFALALAARLAVEGNGELVRVEIVRGDFDLDRCLLERRVHGSERVLGGADLPTAISAPERLG